MLWGGVLCLEKRAVADALLLARWVQVLHRPGVHGGAQGDLRTELLHEPDLSQTVTGNGAREGGMNPWGTTRNNIKINNEIEIK